MMHTLKILRLLLNQGIQVVAPWYTHCLLRSEKDEAAHEMGIAMDEIIVPKLGSVILSGHRLTAGMLREMESLGPDGLVHNLIGVPDRLVAAMTKGLADL